MSAPVIPPELIRYLRVRDEQRENARAEAFGKLTERERALVREAAVMGFVEGDQFGRLRHRDPDMEFPRDLDVLRRVLDGVNANADLYPTMGALFQTDDQEA